MSLTLTKAPPGPQIVLADKDKSITVPTAFGDVQLTQAKDIFVATKSFEFPGTGFIKCGYGRNNMRHDIDTAYSFSGWFKRLGGIGTPMVMLGKNINNAPLFSGYSLQIPPSNTLRWQHVQKINLGRIIATETVMTFTSLTTFYHFVMTFDGTTAAGITWYINGASVPVTIIANNPVSPGLTVELFELSGQFGTALFNGRLFDPAAYAGELTALEVAALYNGGVPRPIETVVTGATLLSQWRADLQTVSLFPSIFDNIGENHGMASGMTFAANIVSDAP